MKKMLITALLIITAVNFTFAGGAQDTKASGSSSDKVKLVFTSWRTEDIERMNRINDEFHKG